MPDLAAISCHSVIVALCGRDRVFVAHYPWGSAAFEVIQSTYLFARESAIFVWTCEPAYMTHEFVIAAGIPFALAILAY